MSLVQLARSFLRRTDARDRSARPEALEVTLLFCDVVRSTELTERLGDLAAWAVIGAYHEFVAGWTRRCGGRQVELRGDGVLLAFDAPRAALTCAVGIQRELREQSFLSGVEVRIGLHAGSALRVDSGYFGGNVILSSRIADSAGAGEILVSARMLEQLDPATAFRVDEERWLSLKGFTGTCQVFAIGWEGDPVDRSADLPRIASRRRARAERHRHSAAPDFWGKVVESCRAPS